MFFDMPNNSTVNTIGDKTISIKTTGADKCHFTVILVCMADGSKLKPAVMFKRKTFPKESCPPGIIVFLQQNGWVDEGILNQWLQKVWFVRQGLLFKKKSLLTWDMFRVHLVQKIKALLNSNATYP